MTNLETVQCSTHGASRPAFVCDHLAENPAQRWFGDYPSADNPWPDAWCGRCNAEFIKQGEWNDKNENLGDITLLCASCYEGAKAESVAVVDAKFEGALGRLRSRLLPGTPNEE